MRGLVIILMLALPLPGFAQQLSDTPENRAALAKDLGDIEAPNIQRSITDMMDSMEQGVPPDQRLAFRTQIERIITYDAVRQYSDLVAAKDMTSDELAALIAFYSSPVGHSVMLKLPLIAQDTVSLLQSMIEQALWQITRGLPNPAQSPL
jgi:hypothetical protein